jgi:hypothetical protein
MALTELKPVKQKSLINARFYYLFETDKHDTVLEVAMWGDNKSIFVNGLEVRKNDIFYDVIIPFLPESVLNEFEAYI